MKTISERIFPRCNPLVHLRAVSLPSRARDVHFKPSTQKKFGVWGCSEKSRKRTLTMLDRPWRYLSGENPIRLQNPLRIEICFDVRNVNKVSAMCADFQLFFSASGRFRNEFKTLNVYPSFSRNIFSNLKPHISKTRIDRSNARYVSAAAATTTTTVCPRSVEEINDGMAAQ